MVGWCNEVVGFGFGKLEYAAKVVGINWLGVCVFAAIELLELQEVKGNV